MNGARRKEPAAANHERETGTWSDETLALRARDGSLDAFETLVTRYESRLLNYLARWTDGDAGAAEDLTQEVFVKAYRSIARFRGGHGFAPWLFTIARRSAISRLRRRRPDEPAWNDDTRPDGAPDPAEAASAREERASLWALARRTLSEPQVTALWLRYGEDLSVKEVATSMRRSVTSVKVLLHRARRRLSVELEGGDL